MFKNIQYERKSGFVSLIEKFLCIMFTISVYFFMKMHPCLINGLAYTLLGPRSVHLSVRPSIRLSVNLTFYPPVRLKFLVRSISSPFQDKSCSYFTHKVHFGKECTVTLNHFEGQRLRSQQNCPEHIFSLLDPIQFELHSAQSAYCQRICRDLE